MCSGRPLKVSPPAAGFHEQFVGQIFNWFRDLQWFSGCSAGDSCDISWVELFLFWVVDCGCVPPFKVDGKWVRVGVDEDAICCVPSAYTLFRTWRRAVSLATRRSFVLRSCDLVPGVAVSWTRFLMLSRCRLCRWTITFGLMCLRSPRQTP